MEQTKSMRIAVVGGAGFIGQSLLKTIRNEHTNIFAIDKKDIDLSVDKNIDELKLRLKTNDVDVVIVLAAVKRQDGDSKEIFHINNKITTNICKSYKI